MKLSIKWILFFNLLLSSWGFASQLPQTPQREVVVLVPGFFNSFAPEYFSKDVVQSFTKKGLQVYLATGLNPIGTIEENGANLESILNQIENLQGRKISFNLVGHSAGGLYSLWVANQNKFKIKNILTVATPFLGVDFVESWLDNCLAFSVVANLAHLDGLKQLTHDGVDQFLKQVRISPETKVYAFAGFQPEGLDFTDARVISTPLRVTSYYTTGSSDGIVSFKSALGLGQIKSKAETSALQFKDTQFYIALEHWEQVLDANSFIFLGIRNTYYIQQEQIRFYSGLADLLLKNQ